MDQILSHIRPFIVLAILAIVAIFAQRRWGSKALLWVWIASAVIIMGATLAWIFYTHGLPSVQELFQRLFVVAFLVAYLFVGIAIASGVVILAVAAFGPRPPHDSSTEINYFPFNLPTGKLEDTYGLAGILARYHELLGTFTTSQDKALGPTPFHPYLRQPNAFLRGFRAYRPSFLRQARISSRQFDQVPNALARDLAGADVVLAELEPLTTAQFAAIEECHRANIRRLRQRSILRWEWWGKITAVGATFVTVVGYGVDVLDKVAGIKPGDFWPHIKNIDLTAVAFQSNFTLWGVLFLVMVAMFFIINLITFAPILRRIRAFEDILTIAKAYRKGDTETNKPSAEPS